MDNEAARTLAGAISELGRELGKEGAAGPGAIEYLADQVKEGLESIASAIREAGEQSGAVSESIDGVRSAVDEFATALIEHAEPICIKVVEAPE